MLANEQTALDTGTPETPPATGKGKAKGKGKGKAAPRAAEGAQKGKAAPASKAKGKGGLSLRQKAALCAGGVATGLLGLSVTHLTEAISGLTGSHWALAGLMAVGIDAGMMASEVALLLSEDRETKRWGTAYVWTAGVASMLLNAWAFAQHATEGMGWTAVPLGILVPFLVLALGKIGGKLWLEDGKGK